LYSAFICELFSFIPSPDTVLIPEYFDHVTVSLLELTGMIVVSPMISLSLPYRIIITVDN